LHAIVSLMSLRTTFIFSCLLHPIRTPKMAGHVVTANTGTALCISIMRGEAFYAVEPVQQLSRNEDYDVSDVCGVNQLGM